MNNNKETVERIRVFAKEVQEKHSKEFERFTPELNVQIIDHLVNPKEFIQLVWYRDVSNGCKQAFTFARSIDDGQD